jgi:hypothetical protein
MALGCGVGISAIAPRPAAAGDQCPDLPDLVCPPNPGVVKWTTQNLDAGALSPSQFFGTCVSCHKTYDAAAFNGQSNKSSGISDWLDFTDPKYLRRASYYLHGKTKAQAGVCRYRNGTMPPGAIKPGQTPSDETATLCQVLAWIKQGMKK